MPFEKEIEELKKLKKLGKAPTHYLNSPIIKSGFKLDKEKIQTKGSPAGTWEWKDFRCACELTDGTCVAISEPCTAPTSKTPICVVVLLAAGQGGGNQCDLIYARQCWLDEWGNVTQTVKDDSGKFIDWYTQFDLEEI